MPGGMLRRMKMFALNIFILVHSSIFSLAASHSNFCQRLDEISHFFTEDKNEYSDEYLAALSNLHDFKKGKTIFLTIRTSRTYRQ